MKKPTLSVILERELVRYEMSGRCTFSASHNAVSSCFQDNDDNKNGKKEQKKYNRILYEKKTRMILHKKEQKHYNRISCTIIYFYLLYTHTYLSIKGHHRII